MGVWIKAPNILLKKLYSYKIETPRMSIKQEVSPYLLNIAQIWLLILLLNVLFWN